MYVRILKTASHYCLLFFLFLSFSSSVKAQSTAQKTSSGVTLYSPYTKISVPPGQSLNYSVEVLNNSNTIKYISLRISGLPSGWTHSLRAGGWEVSQVAVLPKDKKELSLQVQVPLKVNKGNYLFHVVAAGYSSLPLTVAVSKRGTYKTEFTTTQANLEGAANASFTFNALLKNETADTQHYALNADPPPGWTVDFKASYKEVSSVSVNPNQTQNITIEVHPPDEIPAGTYQVPVLASNSNTASGLPLQVVLTGSYGMLLTTPTGLLSTDITAGDEKSMELVVRNTGSAPLKNISLSAASPVNWSVSFDPQKIEALQVGDTAQVVATIKADKNAIAGDYVTSLQAQAPATSSKADIRVSVRTAALWSWVGILIILTALGSVYYLFRRYGRR